MNNIYPDKILLRRKLLIELSIDQFLEIHPMLAGTKAAKDKIAGVGKRPSGRPKGKDKSKGK